MLPKILFESYTKWITSWDISIVLLMLHTNRLAFTYSESNSPHHKTPPHPNRTEPTKPTHKSPLQHIWFLSTTSKTWSSGGIYAGRWADCSSSVIWRTPCQWTLSILMRSTTIMQLLSEGMGDTRQVQIRSSFEYLSLLYIKDFFVTDKILSSQYTVRIINTLHSWIFSYIWVNLRNTIMTKHTIIQS